MNDARREALATEAANRSAVWGSVHASFSHTLFWAGAVPVKERADDTPSAFEAIGATTLDTLCARATTDMIEQGDKKKPAR